MNVHNKSLEDYVKSENHDAINEYLIEVGKNPHLKDLLDIEYLISNSQDSFLYHFAINLIYILGEISRNHFLADFYIKFLIETYFKSDRWIRNEILFAFSKSIRIDDLFQRILDVIEFALVDDYDPIIINALTVVYHVKRIPESYYPKIIKNLESKNHIIVQESIKVLRKHVESIDMFFKILMKDNTINLYSKQVKRNILMTFFNDIDQLEDFKEKIAKSDLNTSKKESLISEIKTYQRIMKQRTV